jgi:GNAT superfamily N-acetyltransferase
MFDTEVPIGRYVDGWGRPGDTALLAIEGGHRVGAGWFRLFRESAPGYGFVDESTPEVTVVVVPSRQGEGIGQLLLAGLVERAQADAYRGLSVSVENKSDEIAAYEAAGFVVRHHLDLAGGEPREAAEYVYAVEQAFAASTDPNVPADNGVSAMLWIRPVLPQYDLLLLERAFAAGVGNDVNIYGVSLGDATDVRDVDALPQPFAGQTVQKTLLANLRALGVVPDNLEGMTVGPRLPNGNPTLVLVSDDNFSAAGPPQVNQFVAFEIDPSDRADRSTASPKLINSR